MFCKVGNDPPGHVPVVNTIRAAGMALEEMADMYVQNEIAIDDIPQHIRDVISRLQVLSDDIKKAGGHEKCGARIDILDANTTSRDMSCASVDVGCDMRLDVVPVLVNSTTRSAVYDHPLGGLAKVTGTAAEIALVLRGAGYGVDTDAEADA